MIITIIIFLTSVPYARIYAFIFLYRVRNDKIMNILLVNAGTPVTGDVPEVICSEYTQYENLLK